ncbi:MAG: SEC-C domain-containing protein [Magnetococcales bacterium]|nr:SEC-C domain-containing protein [Magnetococcales bacterium]
MKIGRNELCLCGSGLKYKRCCLPKEEAAQGGNHERKGTLSSGNELSNMPSQKAKKPVNSDRKQWMWTLTGEIYQPVRLYYRIFDKFAVEDRFRSLHCTELDKKNDRWVWLYHAEAKEIVFPRPYDQIRKDAHPIVIGSFFTKVDDEMHLDVRSIERAVEAILFFDRYLDRSFAKVTHAAILNRLPIDNPQSPRFNFDEFFDNENMTEINPDHLEDTLKNIASESDDINERRQKAISFIMQKMSEEFPEAEKFPVHYYEDGIDQFKAVLRLRQTAAIERWQGEKSVTCGSMFEKIFGKLLP